MAAGVAANPAATGAIPTAASPLGGFEALLAALFGGETQGASVLAKAIQPANSDPLAEGSAEGDAPAATDPTAAQTLLAAFAMTQAPAAPALVTQTGIDATQGDAAAPAAQAVAAPTLGPPAGTVQDLASPTVPAEAAATATTATTDAKSPGPVQIPIAAQAAPIAKDGPVTAEAFADLAPQLPPEGEAAPTSQPTPTTPALAQDQHVAAAPPPPANKSAPATPHAGRPTAAAETETAETAEGAGGTNGTPAPNLAVAKGPKATETPVPQKAEPAHAAAANPGQAPDSAPPPSHASANAEAPPPAATGTAHAAPVHGASLRGAPETVATLAAEILKKLDARTTRFDMELEPYGLGKVDVRLEIGAHGRLTAAMSFENPQSAQDLKNRSGELARALEQAGFDVADGLSFDVADNSNGSGQNNGAQEQSSSAPWRGRAFMAALETAAGADAAPVAAMNVSRLRASGVDIKI